MESTVRRQRYLARRSWYLLLTHTLLIITVTFTLRPTLSYRALELGLSTTWLGTLSVSFALPPLVVAVFIGKRTDRVGERPVLVVGALIVLTAAAGLAFSPHLVLTLWIWNAVLGIGYLLSMIGGQSLAARLAPDGGRERALAQYTLASSVGQAVGPALLALVGGHAIRPDTGRIFLCITGLAFLLLICATVIPSRPREDEPEKDDQPVTTASLLRVPDLARAIMTGVPVLATVDLLGVYLPALGTQHGLSGRAVGFLLVLLAGGSMASRFLLPALLARMGRTRLLFSSMATSAVAVAAIAIPMPVALLAVAVLIAGLGLGIGQPLSLAWVVQVAPTNLRARAIALRLTGNRLAMAGIPAAVGLVASAGGVPSVLCLTGAALGATAFAVKSGADRPPSPPAI